MPEFSLQEFRDLVGAQVPIAGPKVCVASMMKDPPSLLDWIYYHVAIGIHSFSIRLEDPDAMLLSDVRAMQQVLGDRLHVEVAMSNSQQGSSDVMDRIMLHVDKTAIPKARALGAEYLLHIDSDELFYPVNGSTAQEVFSHVHEWRRPGYSEVEEKPADILACIVFINYEALFPNEDCDDQPFTTSGTRFLTEQAYFALYECGKAAAWLGNKNVRIDSVHDFRGGDWAIVPEDAAVILHFDCPGFAQWLKKFQPRAKARWGQEEDTVILDHFNYYTESIAVLSKADSSEKEQRSVYHRYRCLPFYHYIWFDAGLVSFDIMEKIEEGLAVSAPNLDWPPHSTGRGGFCGG